MKVYEIVGASQPGVYMKPGEGQNLAYDGNSNKWVKLEAAQAAINAAYAEGHEAASKSALLRPRQFAAEHESKQPHHKDIGPIVTGDTRTNQLLNELYHDRARLERVVKDAVELCQTAMQLEETERDDSEYVLGLLQQFVDTHDGE